MLQSCFIDGEQVPTVNEVGWLLELYDLQHLRSYQDGYQLVTVRTHGDFEVLPHRKIIPLAP